MSGRGFTLIEAMVTLVITSIVSAAAAGTMALVLRSTSSTKAAIGVENRLDLTIQFLAHDIQNAGGQGLPTQSSIVVENGTCAARDGMPACNGTDRVTIFVAIPDAPICAVRAGSRTGALSFQYVQGGCCFPSVADGSNVSGIVMLTARTGTTRLFRPVLLSGITGATCEFTAVDAMPQETYLNHPDPTLHAHVAVDDFTPFINGEGTLAQMRTYYVDTTTHELRMREGIVSASALVADSIFDLQLATALDHNADGVVADAEWVWRGTDTPSSASFTPRLVPPSEVMLGLVQGLATSLKPDTVASPLRASGNRTITAPGFALLAGAVHLTPHNARLAGP